jgi:hypothetical protein
MWRSGWRPLRALPEMCALNMDSMNFGLGPIRRRKGGDRVAASLSGAEKRGAFYRFGLIGRSQCQDEFAGTFNAEPSVQLLSP